MGEEKKKEKVPEEHRFSIEFPKTLEELLGPKQGKPITSVLKRGDAVPVPFERAMIVAAIQKASVASGRNYQPGVAEEMAEKVEAKLRTQKNFKHSQGSTIPHVEDVQDCVIEVFTEKNAGEISSSLARELNLPYQNVYPIILGIIKEGEVDPTREFYKRYREVKNQVRDKLVHLPFDIQYSSTDTQLQIHRVHDNRKPHNFDADMIMKLILERTGVSFDEAKTAVKKLEAYLANRKSSEAVREEEITSIIDAALMDDGTPENSVLGGRRIPITLDNLNQLMYSKSAENSNIKRNNPEAVNLGIAELALKELALREVFDDDVAEAHRIGMIHLHDLGYVNRVYCSAHSIEYIKKYGLDVIVANLDAKSTPAKSPNVLNNHVHTFLAAVQSAYAGALGFPMLNTLYGPALLREVEMVDGYETLRDESGNVVKRIKKRLKKTTLEQRINEGDIKENDFEIKKTAKILEIYSKKEMKQLAQNLIFGASQSAFSRGGQTLFIDFNIDLDTSEFVAEVPAVFLGAEYKKAKKNEFGELEVVEETKVEPKRHKEAWIDKGRKDAEGKTVLDQDPKSWDVIQPEEGTSWVTYGNDLVRKASREFAEAIFEVSAEGDKYGNMFNFPKIDVHVGRETFKTPESEALLKRACETVEKNDSIYFMYDRGDGMNVSQCCRLRERITDMFTLKHPEKMRFCGFQNVSLNLAQAAYRAKGKNLDERFASTLEEIEKTMLLTLKAHTNKRRFIQHLFEDNGSPMRAMGGFPADDGEPYIDLEKSTYIIGLIGLNECVQHITGKNIDENPEAFKIGLKILSHAYAVKEEFRDRYKMKFVIEETPGESANTRLAKIDQKTYPEEAKKVLRGDIEGNEVYYTNSSHLRADAPVSGLDRTILQSKMNPMIEAGAITHIFSGEKQNRANAVYDFVRSIFFKTQSSQIVFSGEYTICLNCGIRIRGLKDKCPKCGNEDPKKISQKTRVVGYFSDPRAWHKSKVNELKARQATGDYYAGEKQSTIDLEAELLKSIIEPGKIRATVIGPSDCPICDEAMERVRRAVGNEKYVPKEAVSKIEIVKYDLKTEEGRIMAAIYNTPIDTYPTVVVHSGDKFIRKGWEYYFKKEATGLSTKDIADMISPFLSEEKKEK